MPIQSILIDPRNGHSPAVDSATGEAQGLVVASRPLKSYRHKLWFFLNSAYGADMNQNVAFGGTPDAVYTDNSEWTMTAVTGTWDFDETSIKQGGTKSIDAVATVNNSVAQAAKGSTLTLASYTALTGYIYLTAWDTRGTRRVEVFGWNTSTGAQVGQAVNIGNYINVQTLNAWQYFVIPLSTFAFDATTIDALRFRTVSAVPGGPPDYYLDTIRFEETGSPLLYRVRPDVGTWYHVERIRITMADNWVSTLADATLPEIPYDAILGVSALTAGLLYQRIQGGEVEYSYSARQIYHWLQMPGCTMPVAIGDASNTLVSIELPFQVPEVLRFEDNDELRVTVQDNMSGLLLLRMVAAGFEEVRE